MNALTKRKKLAEIVASTNDELLINSLWTAVEKFSVQYNLEVDAATKRVEKGDFYTQKEVDDKLYLWEKK